MEAGDWLLSGSALLLLLFLAGAWWSFRPPKRPAGVAGRVAVLVVGDLGRSPRMQYHALSLARRGRRVAFIGYAGTKPHNEIISNENIEIVPLVELKIWQESARFAQRCSQLDILPTAKQQANHRLAQLWVHSNGTDSREEAPDRPDCEMVRSRLWIFTGCRWPLQSGPVKTDFFSECRKIIRYEELFGSLSNYNICVTNAMKEDLQMNCNIRAITLYDKPASFFKETPLSEQHKLFIRLSEDYAPFKAVESFPPDHVERSAFTQFDAISGSATHRPGRPALLMSSTSWTEDEDFSILLEALKEYEHCVSNGAKLPSLMLFGDFPAEESQLALFRRNLRVAKQQRWDESWEQTVFPLFSDDQSD
ncbi:hypothetical protein Chor_015111 [Crotalus horridus]